MKGRVVWAIAALLRLAAAGWLLPVKAWLGAALTWAASHREPSALVFIALYVLATVCLVPGLILTLAGGAPFGLARGVALVSAGGVLGASAAVFIRRTLAREGAQRRIAAGRPLPGPEGALGGGGVSAGAVP